MSGSLLLELGSGFGWWGLYGFAVAFLVVVSELSYLDQKERILEILRLALESALLSQDGMR